MRNQSLAATAAALLLGLFAAPAFALGEVSVVVAGSNMKVEGDFQSNDILVTQGAGPGQFVVTGRNGTLVNGAPSAQFDGVKQVVMRMGDGADVVEMESLSVRRSLRIRLDEGNDVCRLRDVIVGRPLRIVGGDGQDDISIGGIESDVQHSLRVRGNQGNDNVTLLNVRARNRVRIDGQADNDRVVVESSNLEPRARFSARLGRGADYLELNDTDFENDVKVALGSDDDELRITDCDFEEEFDADGGRGHDTADFDSGNTFKRLPDFDDFEDVD